VLLLLREAEADVEVLLIERTERLDDPATGQVALPGGRVDPIDKTLRSTALREFQEEVGLTESDLGGPFPFISIQVASVFSLRVAVFAAALRANGRVPSIASPEEVAAIFWLPRSALYNAQRVARDTHLGTREVPATIYQGHVLWGFTRRVLCEFFGLPLGPG
jgi:8-oxo-dGTP pyrophosphatase MutT (NUDIX family)